MRKGICISMALGMLSHLSFSSGAQAAISVEPAGSTVAGKTIAEWSAEWWKWAAPLAPPGDPFTDLTGAAANTNQSGPVFYLAGSEATSSRTFSVPTGKYLLVPLLVGEISQLENGFDKTEAQIKAAAKSQADSIDSLHATLDGVTLTSAVLFGHREVSPAFSFVANVNNQVNISGSGASGIAIADGYFLMLDPLSPGTHVLNFGGGISAVPFSINETDTIIPEPSGLLLLSLGSLTLLQRRRRVV